jgi:hypothetical protein
MAHERVHVMYVCAHSCLKPYTLTTFALRLGTHDHLRYSASEHSSYFLIDR